MQLPELHDVWVMHSSFRMLLVLFAIQAVRRGLPSRLLPKQWIFKGFCRRRLPSWREQLPQRLGPRYQPLPCRKVLPRNDFDGWLQS